MFVYFQSRRNTASRIQNRILFMTYFGKPGYFEQIFTILINSYLHNNELNPRFHTGISKYQLTCKSNIGLYYVNSTLAGRYM